MRVCSTSATCRFLVFALLAGSSAVLIHSSAMAGGWGHGPSLGQARKIVGQGAKDFHNGVSSIHVVGPSAGRRGGAPGMTGEHTGDDVTRSLFGPALPLLPVGPQPMPGRPVLKPDDRPFELLPV
jgi:hypothetical protein